MEGIPHHLLDVVDPEEYFSAGNFLELSKIAIEKIKTNGRIPIVVGGSGFYIYSLLYETISNVPPNDGLRAFYETKSNEYLYSILYDKDKKYAAVVDKNNKRRLIRALEIINELGFVPKQEQSKRLKSLNIGLKISQEILEQKIKERIDIRWDKIIDEINLLIKNGVSIEWLKRLGLEYKYITEFITKENDEIGAKQKLFIETRKFSKKQEHWWKKVDDVAWFNPTEINEILNYINKYY